MGSLNNTHASVSMTHKVTAETDANPIIMIVMLMIIIMILLLYVGILDDV